MRVLLAEDDAPIALALRQSLVDVGHAVDHVVDGIAADVALRSQVYDLLVLDLGLPRLGGMEVLERARRRRDDLTVLVVTAREGISERVRALDIGADDLLVKPFALVEFLARSRSLLRRRTSAGIPDAEFGSLRINLDTRRVCFGATELDLTSREFSLFSALYARQQRVVNRKQLIESVCNWEQDLTDNGLDIAMHRLRRKLNGSGVQIRTIRGLGYLLEEVPVSVGETPNRA